MSRNALFLSLVVASSGFLPTIANAEIGVTVRTQQAIRDLDRDGRLTQRDLDALLAYLFDGKKLLAGNSRAMDVNDDGRIDVSDAEALAQMFHGSKQPEIRPVQFTPGDVNDDSAVDITDFMILTEHLTGTQLLQGPAEAVQSSLAPLAMSHESGIPLPSQSTMVGNRYAAPAPPNRRSWPTAATHTVDGGRAKRLTLTGCAIQRPQA